MEIPNKIEGKPVTKIAPFAFYESEVHEILNYREDSNLREIGKGAFVDCRHLTTFCCVYTTRDRSVQTIIPKGVCAGSDCQIIDAFGNAHQ